MTQVISNEHEIKEYYRKRLFYLSNKLVGQKAQLKEPFDEQLQWINNKKSCDTAIDHRPWILRWQYFVLEDYDQ